jgi:hypothetical protein
VIQASREGVVIQASYRGGDYKFIFSRESIVYFNIRWEGSVIQASLRGGKCNLLYNITILLANLEK